MSEYTLQLEDVLEKGMLPVVRKRDIMRARTLTRDEKKDIARGSADVLAITPSGQKIMLKRSEVLDKYSYLDGKKISMAGWSSSKEYVIARMDNSDGVAMMVPLNCTVGIRSESANSKNRSKGDYIVALTTPEGGIIDTTIGIVSAAMFKKMYYMPPNDVITRNIGSGQTMFKSSANENLNERLDKGTNLGGNLGITVTNFTKELNLNTESFDFGEGDIYKQKSEKPIADISSMNKGITIKNDKPKEHEYKYTAIGRLATQENGETVGFIIQSNETKQTKSITKSQMMGLCSKKLVSNIMLGVHGETGKPFLRGNNMRIEALPVYKANDI